MGYIKHKDQRVGVFVDVQNMYYSARNLYKSHLDFKEVLQLGVGKRKLIRASAYVVKADNSEENKFFEALSWIGFDVKQKELQTFAGGAKKGDWDVGMAIDAIKMAPKLDVVILVTGDGDFVPLVEYLQFTGVMVELIAFEETSNARLIEVADDFINLSKKKKKLLIERPQFEKGKVVRGQ